jgi:hypothetical protein
VPAPHALSERSFEAIDRADLDRLAGIARADLEARLERRPQWAIYRDRILCVALVQGAALHYVDGRNGIKDLDVYTFFAAHPARPFPVRWRTTADFGSDKFGRQTIEPDRHGRRVDLFGRSLDVPLRADPVEAVRAYLRVGRTETSRRLAQKAAVLLHPERLRGTVAWPEPIGS